MLDMFLVHVTLILYLLQAWGVQNMLLDMLCEVMVGYKKNMCLSIEKHF